MILQDIGHRHGQRRPLVEPRQVVLAADLEVQVPLVRLEDLLVVTQDDVVRLGARRGRRHELTRSPARLILLELVTRVQVRAGQLGIERQERG